MENGDIELGKVDTGLNAADMLTKNVEVKEKLACNLWGWLKVARKLTSIIYSLGIYCKEGDCDVRLK